MIKIKKKSKKFLTGFTIVELVVVMAIFLFVIAAAISIFISIVQHQKRVLSEQELLSQVSYVEEYMSKALRMAKVELSENCLTDSQNNDHPGYIYLLTKYDSNSQTFKGIKFLNQSDVEPSSGDALCQEFFLDADNILKEEKNNDPATITPITPTSLQIKSIRFSIDGFNGSDAAAFGSPSCPSNIVCGASKDDSAQPRVTILMNIKIAGDSQEPYRTIQTTISERNLKVK